MVVEDATSRCVLMVRFGDSLENGVKTDLEVLAKSVHYGNSLLMQHNICPFAIESALRAAVFSFSVSLSFFTLFISIFVFVKI